MILPLPYLISSLIAPVILAALYAKTLSMDANGTERDAHTNIDRQKQTPLPESATKLYRPNDRPHVDVVSANFCG
jgi:hypothetical protein